MSFVTLFLDKTETRALKILLNSKEQSDRSVLCNNFVIEKAVSKTSAKTNGIERFNCTLGHRVSRLIRETLSFSQKLETHIVGIWYFIHRYNELLRIYGYLSLPI
ncbi:IS1 family transposase [Nostoc sp.]|uniref:IS1 family transposase n=1 Tax=Nostoc sp. TaxID=1180 RepID=UPI003FA59E29